MTEPSKLAEALAKVQAALKSVKPNRKGQSGSREYRYAGLDAVSETVLPILAANGLSFTARPTLNAAGDFVLAYSLRHTSGEHDDGEWPLNAAASSQQRGSEITYARRYCLCAVTGAFALGEDDDGQAASQAPAQRQQRRAPAARTAHADREHADLVRAVTRDRERPGGRTKGPVPDEGNLWQDQPAPNGTGGGRIAAIQMHFKRLGVEDRAVRLGYTATLTGHDVTSTSDLTEDEQKDLLHKLERCKNQAALDQQAKQEASA